jgi:hypothetical protein
MEVEQMMAHLLAKMRTNQAKMDTNLTEIKEDIKTNQAKVGANLREMKEEMKTKMDSHHEMLMMIMKASKENIHAMREACLEKMDACLKSKEPTSGETESVAVHEEVPQEEASVKTVGALKKQHKDHHQAVQHHGQLKK